MTVPVQPVAVNVALEPKHIVVVPEVVGAEGVVLTVTATPVVEFVAQDVALVTPHLAVYVVFVKGLSTNVFELPDELIKTALP